MDDGVAAARMCPAADDPGDIPFADADDRESSQRRAKGHFVEVGVADAGLGALVRRPAVAAVDGVAGTATRVTRRPERRVQPSVRREQRP